MAATRFAIVCQGRTGSSHLVSLLDSHPDVRCYAETLNVEHPKAAGERGFADSGFSDPVDHVLDLLATPGFGAVGFKLPVNSIRSHPSVAGLFERDPGIHAIRLTRRDALSILVSRRLLQATLVSQSIYGSYGDTRVRIEPRACIAALGRIETEEAELDAIVAPAAVFRLDYDELADPARLAELQRFLGVEPTALTSDYERLRSRSLPETVENWDELEGELRRTRFAHLLP